MEGNRRFGMAQVGRTHALEPVLTEVEIIECDVLPDGRYHLEVHGRRRVQVVSTAELDGYRIATVRTFRDEEEEGEQAPPLRSLALEIASTCDQLLTQIRVLSSSNPVAAGRLRSLLNHVGARPTDAELEAGQQGDMERMSFWVATLLLTVSPTLQDHHRMELIRMASSRQRLLWLKEHTGGGHVQRGRCRVM